MIQFHYKEWLRYEAALAVAAWGCAGDEPRVQYAEGCLDIVQAAIEECQQGHELAKALGVDLRRPLEWETDVHAHMHSAHVGALSAYVARHLSVENVYSGGVLVVEGDRNVRLIDLTNFSTHEEAVNALERLLGRAEYDNLFPTPAIAK